MIRFAVFLLCLLAGSTWAAPTDGYVNCAAEGQMCAVATPGVIIYGAGSSYTAPVRLAPPGILCSNAIAGDPINGTVKTCWFRSDTLPPVVAQVDVCTGQPLPAGAVSPYYQDFKEWNGLASPLCAPIKSDTSTGPFEEHNAAGIVAYSYCKIDGKWRKQWGAATWDSLIGKNMAANAKAALASATPLTTFQQLTIATVTTPLSDPSLTAVWCPALTKIRANKPADDVIAGPDVWRTPASGAFTLYATVNGVRTAAISGRKATANATCNCASKIAVGTSTYCPLAGASVNEVTLCQKAIQ